MNLSCALNLSSATIRETCVTYVRSLRQLVVTLSCNYGVIYVINVTILRRETHPPHSELVLIMPPYLEGGLAYSSWSQLLLLLREQSDYD